MRTEEQTSMHLLLAVIVTVFSVVLALIMTAMSWELWMLPAIMAGCFSVWALHIGRFGSERLYENLCSGVMMGEFFFFGIHDISLYDIPAVVCIMILVFSLFDRKRLLYMTAALYVLIIIYHFLYLDTITYGMDSKEIMGLIIGFTVMAGAVTIARYRIDRRKADRRRYNTAFEELETTGRQNAEFLSNVSHELRTPINMVLGISEIALEKELPADFKNDMQSIQLAGKRLSSQINNMLDYTEIVEGTLVPAKEEYMITSVFNDIIAMMTVQGGRYQLEQVFDIDPNTPAVLIGDAEKISHVLKILLENAMKYTEEGGINLCIEFRRESYGINLLIEIHDTGIGMTDFQLTQIYEDFYQAESDGGRVAGGLGLGVPIARGLLRAMGGFIHFENTGEQGLQAYITIPQGVADDAPCVVLPNADKLCVACYFRPEKYSCDEVRRYYDRLIMHLIKGLGIEGYQVHNFDSLLKVQRSHKLTHIFIAQDEYEENNQYYEELAVRFRVVVIAEREFNLPRDSRLSVMHKPISVISVVNLLNNEAAENRFEEVQTAGRRPFVCTGIRVLVVDDEEMNLVVAKGVLGSYGIEVDSCLSGKEAIERCKDTDYDVIFLDHMMPGFDGVQTLKRIREINNGAYKELPVVALTANTLSGAREMFRSEGFTEFIAKPIERSVLERVLRRILPISFIKYTELSVEDDIKAAAKVEAVRNEKKAPAQEAEEVKEVEETKADKAAESMENPFQFLEQAGFNIKLGLDYCCGEEDFYLEMLRMFYAQSKEKKAEIVSLYESSDWKEYAVKVHALKSTSLTIGAEELSAHAKALEQAGKREDADYINENHPTLLRLYEEVCERLAGL